MSITVILNGTQYTLPETNESEWGEDVTNFFEDIGLNLNGTFQTVTASGATTAINFLAGKNVNLALNASTTLTLSNPRTGRPSVFWITQGNTSNTITWPAAVKWQGGTAPDFSGSTGLYIVTLLYNSTSATYVGEFSAQEYS
jgi:hypothetical protein